MSSEYLFYFFIFSSLLLSFLKVVVVVAAATVSFYYINTKVLFLIQVEPSKTTFLLDLNEKKKMGEEAD